jgi:lysophospholipid acyltransferase (LPLAT)-like uncharacterized protein
VALGCSRLHRLKSWDRSLLPLPFSKAVFELGAPLYCPADAPLESLQQQLETAIQAMVALAAARVT